MTKYKMVSSLTQVKVAINILTYTTIATILGREPFELDLILRLELAVKKYTRKLAIIYQSKKNTNKKSIRASSASEQIQALYNKDKNNKEDKEIKE
jgi:hypothetical protein